MKLGDYIFVLNEDELIEVYKYHKTEPIGWIPRMDRGNDKMSESEFRRLVFNYYEKAK